MSGSRTAGDFLKGLSADQYARISVLLDESIDMSPGDREIWLAALEQLEPESAAVLRNMFAARRERESDNFLQDIPAVLGHGRSLRVLRLIRRLMARLMLVSKDV